MRALHRREPPTSIIRRSRLDGRDLKRQILWPQQSSTLTDTIIGKTARLVIYRANAAGAPITNTTLIYQEFVTVGVTETFQTYNLTTPPQLQLPQVINRET